MPYRTVPRQAWDHLIAGNERFATDSPQRPNASHDRREELRKGQAPFAAVLACSDSRVPVELLFDAGLGDLFVVRTAGGTVDAAVSGSLQFAVKSLGVSLIVVLSHESCGAVAAAMNSFQKGNIPKDLQRVFVEKIAPSVIQAKSEGHLDPAGVEATHAKVTAEHIIARIPELAEGLVSGDVGVVAARYRLEDGRVTSVEEHFGI
ncbi:carbonic anhydrase [Corynebacterium aquatimens]|uniref:Carbonic anhydrase n=1 Tax=Corynebacterium aquatimens TaxID=1190508 RepID=A0A931DXV3_9CORY|nr:carbonic anhydrase [Corynebacterium aquatimens]MBG6122327.1 carbonic anhydrase [Corynebacterium aquatimens]WJY65131.1 Carbonic anhydrase 2 [Corynebacterium aquatimens]